MIIAAIAAAAQVFAPAQPGIDFSGVQDDLAGAPTRALVLGTRHLNQLPDDAFDPADLHLVLDRLAAFEPDIIAIEAINGRGCDAIRRFAATNPDAVRYCRDPKAALEALGLTFPEAVRALEEGLAAFPAEPSAADRRGFALLFFAAGEPWSAAVQWAYLAEDERIAEDGVTEDLAAQFDRLLASRNENNLLGVRLAVRLGLQSLAAIDDHSADLIQARAPEVLGPVIRQVWAEGRAAAADTMPSEAQYLVSPEALLAGYRYLNSPAHAQLVIDLDFGRAAATPDEGAVARQYVGWWQTRGLRMAANVVEAAGNQPGARVLVITGASHKAYFDAYLDQMHDWSLVSVDAVMHD